MCHGCDQISLAGLHEDLPPGIGGEECILLRLELKIQVSGSKPNLKIQGVRARVLERVRNPKSETQQ